MERPLRICWPPACLAQPAAVPAAPSAQGHCITCSFEAPLGPLSLPLLSPLPAARTAGSRAPVPSQLVVYLLCEAVLRPLQADELFLSSRFLLHFVNTSTEALYCIAHLFACLFLLLDCKHHESRNCFCPQSLAQCLACNSLSVKYF